jgi:hypothetical protein
MKSSLINTTVYLNDQVIDDVNNLDPYTVYVNPFYVVTGFQGGDRVSKHYYSCPLFYERMGRETNS